MLLSEAESLLGMDKWTESAVKSATAMKLLMKISSEYSPLGRVQRLYSITNGLHGHVHVAIEKLAKSIERIHEGMTLQMQIVMGLDFKGYARFKHLAPTVNFVLDGSIKVGVVSKDLNTKESKWLLDYVLGNVLRMEEAGLEWHEL